MAADADDFSMERDMTDTSEFEDGCIDNAYNYDGGGYQPSISGAYEDIESWSTDSDNGSYLDEETDDGLLSSDEIGGE